MFVSKRGFSSLQTRKSFGEILSENHRFLRPSIRLWLNDKAMFYETSICFYISEAKPLCSVFVHKWLMTLNDVEYTTFKMFVTQMSNYLFVISFQLMFYKTLCYRLARALRNKSIVFRLRDCL